MAFLGIKGIEKPELSANTLTQHNGFDRELSANILAHGFVRHKRNCKAKDFSQHTETMVLIGIKKIVKSEISAIAVAETFFYVYQYSVALIYIFILFAFPGFHSSIIFHMNILSIC